jgi:DnaJ-class molecular chaperone
VQAEIFVPFRTAALGGELEVTVSKPKRQQLTIRIPPGLVDGDKLRLSVKGMPPTTSSGKPGDLIVVTRIEPHPFFARKGVDLYLEAPIALAEALLGVELEVPTLEGRASITVPPGASSGQKLRLRGKGVPQRDGQRGDLYVQLKLVAPKSVSERVRALAEELRKADPTNPRRDLGWFS